MSKVNSRAKEMLAQKEPSMTLVVRVDVGYGPPPLEDIHEFLDKAREFGKIISAEIENVPNPLKLEG